MWLGLSLGFLRFSSFNSVIFASNEDAFVLCGLSLACTFQFVLQCVGYVIITR